MIGRQSKSAVSPDEGPLARRSAGILLHPTSLPGPHGVGDLGPAAYHFVDFLSFARQSLWQILPLNPTGGGNSPYAAPSAFAGNALLISLDRLLSEGLIGPAELARHPGFPRHYVDYQRAWAFKLEALRSAWRRFAKGGTSGLRVAYDEFCARHADWLEDYALFMAQRLESERRPWWTWPAPLAAREPDAVSRAREALAPQIDFHRFLQFVFHRQWSELHRYANRRGISIVGDLPIFVAHDSVDVWANRDLFHLDRAGQPTAVAGVPPDYFSPTGQRWGNPLYRWDRMADTAYAWWVARLRAVFGWVDVLRLDHFRGFQAFWHVPASHATAQHGHWAPGPGLELFRKLEADLGKLPIIVEDLGLITPDVEELRIHLGYPGMKVLQFAFDGEADNPYLPHNYERRCVVYTATHDNDTTIGWFRALRPAQRANVRRYVGTGGRDIVWDLIRLALASVADTAIAPLQDVLALPSAARMNYPGQSEGNWLWRLAPGQLSVQHGERLAELTAAYGRDIAPKRD